MKTTNTGQINLTNILSLPPILDGDGGAEGTFFTAFTRRAVTPSLTIYHLPLAGEDYKKNSTQCQRSRDLVGPLKYLQTSLNMEGRQVKDCSASAPMPAGDPYLYVAPVHYRAVAKDDIVFQ